MPQVNEFSWIFMSTFFFFLLLMATISLMYSSRNNFKTETFIYRDYFSILN